METSSALPSKERERRRGWEEEEEVGGGSGRVSGLVMTRSAISFMRKG